MHRMLVKEIMQHPVFTVRADAPIADAAQLMADYDVRRLPVVDDEGCIIGIVAEPDIREAEAASSTINSYDPDAARRWLTVGEIMSRDPITIGPDASVGQLVHAFLEHKIGGVPVIESDPHHPRCDRLVGIVTEMDIFRMIADMWAQEWGEGKATAAQAPPL